MFLHVLRCMAYMVTSLNQPKVGMLQTCHSRIYVGFRKLDGFLHVNNARYLEIFEFARWQHGVRSGIFTPRMLMKCYPVVGTIHVQYMQQLKAFQMVTVETRICGRHDKSLLIEQRIVANGTVAATALVKATFISGGKAVDVAKAMEIYECAHLIPEVAMSDPSLAPKATPAPTTTTPAGPQEGCTRAADGSLLLPPWCSRMNFADDEWRAIEREASKARRNASPKTSK
jgi:YbgC/YbaW family acyl-CoA thioester hydrolase